MQEYLLTHPSLFIITITIIVIMLIYIFRDKIKKNYTKVEDTCLESTCSIEMQTMTALPNIPYDEPDLIAPLPKPKLYKKIRNDLRNASPKYDIPRIHGIPETPEPSTSAHTNNLEDLEKKYNIVQPPTSFPLINNVEQPVIHRVKVNKSTDNRVSVSDVHQGSYVNFDGEFDEFDDLSRRSNVMRITLNFDPDEPPINV